MKRMTLNFIVDLDQDLRPVDPVAVTTAPLLPVRTGPGESRR